MARLVPLRCSVPGESRATRKERPHAATGAPHSLQTKTDILISPKLDCGKCRGGFWTLVATCLLLLPRLDTFRGSSSLPAWLILIRHQVRWVAGRRDWLGRPQPSGISLILHHAPRRCSGINATRERAMRKTLAKACLGTMQQYAKVPTIDPNCGQLAPFQQSGIADRRIANVLKLNRMRLRERCACFRQHLTSRGMLPYVETRGLKHKLGSKRGRSTRNRM